MIHYHGTPLTPQSEMNKMAGKHFCVSFANRHQADWCLRHGQSVMWDNGAFTIHSAGGALDVGGYKKWLEPRLGHPHWCVIPDVIGGDEQAQRELVTNWDLPRELSAPVWHMGLSIEWLLDLASNWPKICFGSSHAYWQVGSDLWARRADEAFNAMARRGLSPWVHMMRGLSLCGDHWPFASADSTNVARNFKDARMCPERMARRIDGVQCPIFWRAPPKTMDLFEPETTQ